MKGGTAPIEDKANTTERLGYYTLLREIGRGAAAVVYEARDERMDRTVAVKAMTPAHGLTPSTPDHSLARFRREARAVARLSHPNIVAVYDMGEQDGVHFLVLEFLRGQTLRERLDHSGPLSPAETVAIVTQIARALDAIHAEGMVHRDIKPSNVMLLPPESRDMDGSEKVKLLDFGIARQFEDSTVTHDGTLIGSPAYMSPEQARGEAAGRASDVWALGVLVYEMLTGVPPFAGAQITSVLYQITHEPPPSLPADRSDIAAAHGVLLRALAKAPSLRYPSAGALASALAVAFAAPRTTAAVPVETVSAAPPQRKPNPRMVPALLGTACLTGVAALLLPLFVAAPKTTSGIAEGRTAAVPSTPSLQKPRATPAAMPRPSVSLPSPSPSAAVTRTVSPRPKVAVALAKIPAKAVRPAASPAALVRRITAVKPLKKTVFDAPLPNPAPTPQRPSPRPTVEKENKPVEGTKGKAATLVGTWRGNIGKHRAVLVIRDLSDDNGFSGTATVQTPKGPAKFVVSGSMSRETGSLSFWATDSAAGGGFDLGQENGRLLEPELMGGLGLDSAKHLYTWSLSRQ